MASISKPFATRVADDPVAPIADGSRARLRFIFAVLAVLVCVAIVAGVATGSSSIPPGTVIRILAGQVLPENCADLTGVSEAEQVIVWLARMPRVLVAACVGASLAVAGVQLQGLFRNPLASPDIIGASSGASFGAVLALASGLAMRSVFYLPIMSFVGALLVLLLVYAIAARRGRTPIATLLLAGVAVNSMLGAATSFLITAKWVRYEVSQEILFWLMGGLDSRTWEHVWLLLPSLAVGICLALLHARDLDALLLGEESALAIGIEVERLKRIIITSAALLAGGAVAVSGLIGFVGLIVPHMVRLVMGPRHRPLLLGSALAGAAFLIIADLLARTIMPPTEIRLGIITALAGSPFFLYLICRQQAIVSE